MEETDIFLSELQSNNFVFLDEKQKKDREKEFKKQNIIIEKQKKQEERCLIKNAKEIE